MAALSMQLARCASLAKCISPAGTFASVHAAKLSSFARSSSKWSFSNLRFLAVAGLASGAIGHAYMRGLELRKDPIGDIFSPLHTKSITHPGTQISRVVSGPTTTTGLKITMYQYQTCPFCCKVRAFLDFYGIPYNVVEVDPVLRQQLKFSEYKKVPILLVEESGKCWQINDSTVIISMLQSYLRDMKGGFRKYLCLYEPVKIKDASGKESLEVFNKYFLMMDTAPAQGKALIALKEEQTWRMWADDVLVHVLSPNVYRTWQEALQAFNYFSEVGEWERNFPTWERLLVIYVGAAAMYFVAKRLKKRHSLKDDVRESFRDACREWITAVGPERKFHGGSHPNLADLAEHIAICKLFERPGLFPDIRQIKGENALALLPLLSTFRRLFLGALYKTGTDCCFAAVIVDHEFVPTHQNFFSFFIIEAVYGVLNSVEGCTAFEDMLTDTKIGDWYYRMKEATASHAGTRALSAMTC